MRLVVLVCLILSFLISNSFSQVTISKPLVIEKPAVVRKIAWVDGNKFCLVSDRMTQGGFLHFITVFDTSGKMIHPIEKIYTKFSIQHEYFLVLENTLFFFDHLSN